GCADRQCATPQGTATNPAAATSGTATKSVARPVVLRPRAASHAMSGNVGSAYLTVKVSWNTRWNTRYGINATSSTTSAALSRISITSAPHRATAPTASASGVDPQGSTNVSYSAKSRWRGVGSRHSI